MYRSRQIAVYAFLALLWVLPAAAQVEYKGVQMSMGANLDMGYGGDFGNLGGSDHGIEVGGSGSLAGSYYNPGFLSFGVQPYYGRSQATATSGSIFDTSGYNGDVAIFSGSHFPGIINFNQVWNDTGIYGIPGTTGLTTRASNRTLGIAWGEVVPGLPSVSAFYAHGSGSSSLLGSDEQNESTSDNYGIRSGYRLAGWNLGAHFLHQTLNSNTAGLLEGVEAVTSNASDNSYGFEASHRFPLKGSFGLGFGRSDYSSSYGGGTGGSSTGTTDDAYANLSLQLWRFPINATSTYEDNLQGVFEEQLLSSGVTPVQTNISPESRSLLTNVNTSYRLMPHVVVNGYVSRQELFLNGQSYGFTQFGANATFGLFERFKGLTATIGMNDSADKQGNTGAGLVAAVNYTGNVGRWGYGASFSYDQFVETMFAIYQTSSMAYGANLSRRFANGLSWTLNGGGSRTAFEQVAGNGSQAETVSSSLSWRGYTAAGSFSQSNGTSVLTPTGLVAVPTPFVFNNVVVFSGRGYGLGLGGSPAPGLSVSVSYSQANSNTQGQNLSSNTFASSNNNSEIYTGLLTYRFRKVYFTARAIRFRQSIGASGTPPSLVNSYYFGVSRWFKLF